MERDHHHEAAEEEMRDRVVPKLLMTYSEAVWSRAYASARLETMWLAAN
jgi:hypothetical protein